MPCLPGPREPAKLVGRRSRALISRWAARGWLRNLDAACRFLWREVAAADPLLILAAALASHQLGRGHVCLDLAATLRILPLRCRRPRATRMRNSPLLTCRERCLRAYPRGLNLRRLIVRCWLAMAPVIRPLGAGWQPVLPAAILAPRAGGAQWHRTRFAASADG